MKLDAFHAAAQTLAEHLRRSLSALDLDPGDDLAEALAAVESVTVADLVPADGAALRERDATRYEYDRLVAQLLAERSRHTDAAGMIDDALAEAAERIEAAKGDDDR